MKIWVDDKCPAPEGYVWVKSTNEAVQMIYDHSLYYWVPGQEREIDLIDLDDDAGDYAWDGGHYIKVLNWMEYTGRVFPIHIHSTNTTEIQKMRAIIQRNGWTEVF